ncbi:hypothetical protein H8959_002945 [Pygathrix nigripes]
MSRWEGGREGGERTGARVGAGPRERPTRRHPPLQPNTRSQLAGVAQPYPHLPFLAFASVGASSHWRVPSGSATISHWPNPTGSGRLRSPLVQSIQKRNYHREERKQWRFDKWNKDGV